MAEVRASAGDERPRATPPRILRRSQARHDWSGPTRVVDSSPGAAALARSSTALIAAPRSTRRRAVVPGQGDTDGHDHRRSDSGRHSGRAQPPDERGDNNHGEQAGAARSHSPTATNVAAGTAATNTGTDHVTVALHPPGAGPGVHPHGPSLGEQAARRRRCRGMTGPAAGRPEVTHTRGRIQVPRHVVGPRGHHDHQTDTPSTSNDTTSARGRGRSPSSSPPRASSRSS